MLAASLSSSSSTTTTVSPVSSDQSSVEDLKSTFVTRRHNPVPLLGYAGKSILKEREMNLVVLDHSYSKSWTAYPFASRARPARLLFFSYPARQQTSENLCPNEYVDVDSVLPTPTVSYDAMKSRLAMGECERFVGTVLMPDGGHDDWEEHIDRSELSFARSRLLNKAIKILNTDRLSRLTYEGAVNEPVMRRIAIDRSAKRFRQLFSAVGWDLKLTQWLHNTFKSHLSASYMSAYLDILQVLKSKLPALMDKILVLGPPPSKSSGTSASTCGPASGVVSNSSSLSNATTTATTATTSTITTTVTTTAAAPGTTATGSSSGGGTAVGNSTGGNSINETLSVLLKRPWDPAPPSYSQKLKKLPGSPMLLITPFGPSPSTVNQMKRMRFWNSQFLCLGKVIPVTMHTIAGGRTIPIGQCLEHMVNATRTKIVELRSHFPNRPIVLIGWAIGALVACQVALVDHVSAVVCLGFPFTGVKGGRGEVDDPLLESRTPVMFVIGQFSPHCGIDDLEDMRERMKADTSLVVVGGGDDLLRVGQRMKKMEGITQSMVDRCVMEEVSEFLTSVFSNVSESLFSARQETMTGGQGLFKDGRRRKRKSDVIDSDVIDLQRSSTEQPLSISWKVNKDAHLLDISAIPGTSGAQSSVFSTSTADMGLKIGCTGNRSYNTVRLISTPKKQKFDNTGLVTESTSSDSSNNSILGGTSAVSGENASFASAPIEKTSSTEDIASVPCVIPSSKSSGGIAVSIGALSSLGSARAAVALTSQKAVATMTSLVNRTPTKMVQTAASTSTSSNWNLLSTASQQLPKISTGHLVPGSVPISFHSVPVKSAFSVPRVGVRPTIGISSIMTYAVSSQGVTTSTQSTSSSQPTSLLLSNKVGSATAISSLGSVCQAGRLIVCKTSEPNEEQVQAIQKMQFHDFPLTTASLTKSVGTPVITQAKILTSRGLDLKRLQTLSSSLAGQGLSTHTTTSGSPSLLIATGGKPLLVSGSALQSVAKLRASVDASRSDGEVASTSLTAESVLEQARRANPHLNFTVSSVKLHLPERRQGIAISRGTGGTASQYVPKVSLIMLSSKSNKPVAGETTIRNDVSEGEVTLGNVTSRDISMPREIQLLLPTDSPTVDASPQEALPVVVPDVSVIEVTSDEASEAVSTIGSEVVAATDSITVVTSPTDDANEIVAEVPVVGSSLPVPVTEDVAPSHATGTDVPKLQEQLVNSASSSGDMALTVVQETALETPPATTAVPAPRGSARNRPPPFPTIAATRTRRIRAPKYMYYDL